MILFTSLLNKDCKLSNSLVTQITDSVTLGLTFQPSWLVNIYRIRDVPAF